MAISYERLLQDLERELSHEVMPARESEVGPGSVVPSTSGPLRSMRFAADPDLQAVHADPLRRDRADGARHELHVQSALRQQRQQRVQLAIADERLAADDRYVERPQTIDAVEFPPAKSMIMR